MPTGDILESWDFHLPAHHIASRPTSRRDESRLLRVPLSDGDPTHLMFSDLVDQLREGDLLVGNDTQVMRARLAARRLTGGAVELLVLDPDAEPTPALARPARKLREGEMLVLEDDSLVRVVTEAVDGIVGVTFPDGACATMTRLGALPLPPYLRRPSDERDDERYQTVFAETLGAAAAPTAGLHFTPDLLASLRERGVGWATVTLHVGLGTFRPLRSSDLERGSLHVERFEVPEVTARAIRRTRAGGRRVIAVGTTTARALESATHAGSAVPTPGSGTTDIFIRPPYRFRSLDGLITNFHLPKSSLLMLVASLVGRERLFAAYDEAIHKGYRFYSYGDAMLLI